MKAKLLRIIVILLFDITVLAFSNFLSFFVRLEKFNILSLGINEIVFIHFLFYLFIYLLIFFSFKFNDISIRFFSFNHSRQIIIPFLLIFIIWTLTPIISNISQYPRSIGLLTFLIFLVFFISSRVIISIILNYEKLEKKKVIFIGFNSNIYDLIISYSKKNIILSIFVEGHISLINKNILGIKVTNIEKLLDFLNIHKVEEIIIDNLYFQLPIIKKLFLKLDQYQSKIMVINSKDNFSIDNIQQVEINDILDRGISKLNFNGKFSNKDSILITGGAGSIGSSILKEIIISFPYVNLVCLDFSEFNIYKLKSEEIYKNVKFIIGDVGDKKLLNQIILDNNISIIFHAAAFKHVPLMEENIYQSFVNNSKGTLNIVDIALNHKIDKFIFISSDKAVRPTNVMGLTKRIAESIININQQKFKNNEINTKFAIVRFGNVIESSGSLIPLLKSQIIKGGPITLTHPEVTRYFMTLSEAAHLVVESSFLTKGTETFLFEMGKAIKVIDLAKRMVNLHGLQIKSEKYPSGIEIKIIGLRPGEKLFEELLVDHKSIKTINPNIFISDEKDINKNIYKKYINFINQDLINIQLNDLEKFFGDEYAKYNPKQIS